VIHKGCVVEEGAYDELSERENGFFKRLKMGIEM
jgi:ABC-type multidrug transport system fused ATPase/permease subunit